MTECLCEGGETTQCPGGAKLLGVGAGRDAAGRQDRLEPEGSGGQMGGAVCEPQGEQSTASEQRGKAGASRSGKAGPTTVGGGWGWPPTCHVCQ